MKENAIVIAINPLRKDENGDSGCSGKPVLWLISKIKASRFLRKTSPCQALALVALLSCAAVGNAHEDTAQVEARVSAILSAMTLAEKLDYISGENFGSPQGVFNIKPIARLGIPEILATDGTIGLVGQGFTPGTRYPSGQLLASTWNSDRAFDEGLGQGREARARGIYEVLGPGLDFYRTPFGGRNPEYMTGEDPYLGAVLVAAEINAMQSQQLMATTKHYVCNDQEINRFGLSVQVDERTLREIYLPPYESAVKLGNTAAIMSAENLVNGVYNSANSFLLTTVLKQEWGFKGFVETDTAGDHDGLQAALAGLDIDMPGNFAKMTSANLLPAIQSGQLPVATIDDKVRRILRDIVSYGFLDRPQLNSSIPVNDPRSKTTAVNVAREGIVLLKNDSKILPLDKNRTRRIAVIGANAQGEPPTTGGSAEVAAVSNFTSEIDGIKAQAPNATVDYISACVPDPTSAVWQTGTGTAGLVGEYFNSSDLSGSPVATRVDTEVNFTSFTTSNVPVSNPASFSVIWTGKVQPTITGYQVFKVASAGPPGAGAPGATVRFFVNNQLILDDTTPNVTPDTPVSAVPPFVPASGKIYLQAGTTYDVRVEATKVGTSGSNLQISWASLQPPANISSYNAVVLALGTNDQYESEGHDRSFALPEEQDTLIQNVVQANPQTIVVMHGGGGFDVQAWVDQVPALLHAWFPGQYGGQALAEILFGVVNPSGKLPITMEKRAQDNPAFATFPTSLRAKTISYSEGLFIGYRGYEKNEIQPQYPFGYGLSYTTFRYSDLDIDSKVLQPENGLKNSLTQIDSKGRNDDVIQVSFRITNSGNCAGAETAELYVAPVNPPVVRPLKELKGFTKVYLGPGESRKVSINLDKRSLAYYDVNAQAWDVARGSYTILVGSSSQDIRLNGSIVNPIASSVSVSTSSPVPPQNVH
jgi:beta-glucosidase